MDKTTVSMECGDLMYGCFTARLICDNCKKLIIDKGLSYTSNKVGPGDTDKVRKLLDKRRHDCEIFYCPKCGMKLPDCQL